MATHSSTLAWEIPWMEGPGGLQSMVLQRVGHDWATSLWAIGYRSGADLPVLMVVKIEFTDGPTSELACYMPGSSSYAHFTSRKLEHREVTALAQAFLAANVRMGWRGPEVGDTKQGTDKVPLLLPLRNPQKVNLSRWGAQTQWAKLGL